MDLKEKILKDVAAKSEYVTYDDIVENVKEEIHEAMEELSKIVVIAFDIWRVNNGWIRCSNAKHQITYFGVNNRLEKITYTTEQLYELFTQSKEYQELMDAK